jgi:triosephosphate isomerase (TIM)
MRRKIIAGNWKMNLNAKNVQDLVSGILKGLPVNSQAEMMIFPSTIHLSEVVKSFQNTKIQVGAQNIYPSGLAAFTGELSCDQLTEYGIKTVLIGHSERRQFLKESNEFLNQKVLFALQKGFTPMLCIGETLSERESNQTFSVVKTQLLEGLKSLKKEEVSKVLLAYEPVWAIGTGKVATPEQAEEVHAFIRNTLSEIYDSQTSESISILYGGSVKQDNIKSLMEKSNIDGGLVGGASQKSESYLGLFA